MQAYGGPPPPGHLYQQPGPGMGSRPPPTLAPPPGSGPPPGQFGLPYQQPPPQQQPYQQQHFNQQVRLEIHPTAATIMKSRIALPAEVPPLCRFATRNCHFLTSFNGARPLCMYMQMPQQQQPTPQPYGHPGAPPQQQPPFQGAAQQPQPAWQAPYQPAMQQQQPPPFQQPMQPQQPQQAPAPQQPQFDMTQQMTPEQYAALSPEQQMAYWQQYQAYTQQYQQWQQGQGPDPSATQPQSLQPQQQPAAQFGQQPPQVCAGGCVCTSGSCIVFACRAGDEFALAYLLLSACHCNPR